MAVSMKYRPPIPIWVLVLIVVFIIGLIVSLLAVLGYIDLSVVGATFLGWFMAPAMWATTGPIQSLILYGGIAGITFFIAFLIAKRRYIVGQNVAIGATAPPAYQPQVGLSQAAMYPQPATQPTMPQPEQQKEEAKA